MKKAIRILGIIAFSAIIGFSMAACGETPGGTLPTPPPGDTQPSTSLGSGDIAGIITKSGIFANLPAGSTPITAAEASAPEFMTHFQSILFPINFALIIAINDAISYRQPGSWGEETLTRNFPLTEIETYLAGLTGELGVSNLIGEAAFHRTVEGSLADSASMEGTISRNFSAYFDSIEANPSHFSGSLPLLAGKFGLSYTRDFKIVSTNYFDEGIFQRNSYARNQTLLDSASLALAFVDQGIYGIITADTTFGRREVRTRCLPAEEHFTEVISDISAALIINVFAPGNDTPIYVRVVPEEEVIALFMAHL